MRKRLLVSICATIVLITGFATPAMAAEVSSDPTQIILDNINAYRTDAGSPIIATQDPRLVAIAQDWAEELQSDPSQAMVHNPNVWAMIQPATKGGETVSQYYDEHQVAAKWYQSGAHRPILISAAYNAVGIGYVHDPVTGAYWIVADFAYYPPANANTTVPSQSAPPTLTRDGLNGTVTWANNDGQGHYIKLYDADGNWVAASSFLTNPTATYTFNNLQRGKVYYATISTYNGYGQGPESMPSTSIDIPALAPLEVTTAYIFRQDADTVFTYWWASKNINGAAVTSYTLNLYKDGVLYATDESPAANGLSHTYHGLAADATYKIGVIVNNAVGASPEVISPVGAYIPVIPPVRQPVSDPIVIPTSIPTPTATTQSVPTQQSVIPSTPTENVTPTTPVVTPTPVTSLAAPATVTTPVVTPPVTANQPVQVPSPAPTVTKAPTVAKTHAPAKPRVSVRKATHRKLNITWQKVSLNRGAGITRYVVRVQQGHWVRSYAVSAATVRKMVQVPSSKKMATVTVTAYNKTGNHTGSVAKRSHVKA